LAIEAEAGGRVLVDATSLVLRDAVGTEAALRQSQQGTFRLDPVRSSIYPPRTKAFPKNTEVEAILTFAGENPGELVRNVTPEPSVLSLRMHHSFVEAPTGTSLAPQTRASATPPFASVTCPLRSTRAPRCSGFGAGASKRRIQRPL
jgi:hypothetical protein